MTDDRIKGVWLASHPIYYTKKGEANVKNEFKAGDLVFELDFYGGIKLQVLKSKSYQDGDFHVLTTRYGYNYSKCGRAYPSFEVPHLLHATPEIRQALVTLYGEDAVPKLPVRGSELTKKLLEKQKYVLCLVSHVSDDNARRFNPPKLHIVTGVEGDYFNTLGGISADFAVPVDNNGNEIMDYEE